MPFTSTASKRYRRHKLGWLPGSLQFSHGHGYVIHSSLLSFASYAKGSLQPKGPIRFSLLIIWKLNRKRWWFEQSSQGRAPWAPAGKPLGAAQILPFLKFAVQHFLQNLWTGPQYPPNRSSFCDKLIKLITLACKENWNSSRSVMCWYPIHVPQTKVMPIIWKKY